MISVQLGELGEELAREKPVQSKVEMLEAQVRIMQEKLSKVRNINTMHSNKTTHLAATNNKRIVCVLKNLLILCLSVVGARVPVLSGSWTASPVGSRERKKSGELDRNYSNSSSATSSRSASKRTHTPCEKNV